MKNRPARRLLRYFGLVWVSTSIAIAVLSVKPTLIPVLANPAQEQVARRMAELKNTNQRWIEVNLSTQRLIAWEGGRSVYAVIIATGKPSTPTTPGMFAVQTKQPQIRMRGAGFDVPDVPFVLYYNGASAIHGAYWLNRFGRPVSHGTVYLAVNHAQWLYDWANIGTPVVIH